MDIHWENEKMKSDIHPKGTYRTATLSFYKRVTGLEAWIHITGLV